jgi:hypothetical protein
VPRLHRLELMSHLLDFLYAELLAAARSTVDRVIERADSVVDFADPGVWVRAA